MGEEFNTTVACGEVPVCPQSSVLVGEGLRAAKDEETDTGRTPTTCSHCDHEGVALCSGCSDIFCKQCLKDQLSCIRHCGCQRANIASAYFAAASRFLHSVGPDGPVIRYRSVQREPVYEEKCTDGIAVEPTRCGAEGHKL